MRFLLAFLIVFVVGCKKNPACEALAEMTLKCDTENELTKSGDKEQAKTVILMLCENSFEGKGEELQQSMRDAIKQRAQCAKDAKTCEDFAKCDR